MIPIAFFYGRICLQTSSILLPVILNLLINSIILNLFFEFLFADFFLVLSIKLIFLVGCLVLFDFTFYRINLWRNSHSDGIRRLYLYEAIGSSVLFILHFISMILIRVAKLHCRAKTKKLLTF